MLGWVDGHCASSRPSVPMVSGEVASRPPCLSALHSTCAARLLEPLAMLARHESSPSCPHLGMPRVHHHLGAVWQITYLIGSHHPSPTRSATAAKKASRTRGFSFDVNRGAKTRGMAHLLRPTVRQLRRDPRRTATYLYKEQSPASRGPGRETSVAPSRSGAEPAWPRSE